MIDQIYRTGHDRYLAALDARSPPATPPRRPMPAKLSLRVVAPAFLISELTTALWIGFLIYLPFLVVDLVVSAVLAAMGLIMLPPSQVAAAAEAGPVRARRRLDARRRRPAADLRARLPRPRLIDRAGRRRPLPFAIHPNPEPHRHGRRDAHRRDPRGRPHGLLLAAGPLPAALLVGLLAARLPGDDPDERADRRPRLPTARRRRRPPSCCSPGSSPAGSTFAAASLGDSPSCSERPSGRIARKYRISHRSQQRMTSVFGPKLIVVP